jgi:predicted  nucleic acid-binding Zn-ribbon protein
MKKKVEKISQKVAGAIEVTEVTIESLAVMIQHGFAEQAQNLNEFKTEMYEFKSEMLGFKSEMYEFKEDMLGFKFDVLGFKEKTEGILFSLDCHAEETNRRLTAIEKTLEPIARDFPIMKKEIAGLNVRVDRLEKKTTARR